ncbi:MAG: translocation/assembly module TamB domain-containing protein [Pseudomonadota bacterium]|nr:translocation/assembly module TamB domain-containing protein [Pseudomonadota bacterium]
MAAPAPEPLPKKPRRRWRLLSAFFVFLGGLLALVAVVVIGAGISARTDGGRAWLRDRIVGLIRPVNGGLTVGTLETDLYSNVVLHDITLTDAAGGVVGHIDTLTATYRLGGLPGRVLVVPTVRAEGLDLTLTETPTGVDIAGLWDDGSPPSGKPWTGVGLDLVFPDVAIAGARVRYRRLPAADAPAGEPAVEYGFDAATLTTSVALRGPAVLVDGLKLDSPRTVPAMGALSVATDMRWDPTTLWFDAADVGLGPNRVGVKGGIGRLDGEATVGLQIATLHVDTDSLAPLLGTAPAPPTVPAVVPAVVPVVVAPAPLTVPTPTTPAPITLPVTGIFDATGGIAGLLKAPTALLEIKTPGGVVHANANLDLREPRATWGGSLTLDTVAVHTFVPAVPDPMVLGGVVTVDGAGFGWPADLDANAVFALTAPALDTFDSLSARGTAHLVNGVVDVPELVLDGPGMHVDAAATVRLLGESGDARLRTVWLDLAQLDRFGAAGGRGRVAFTGSGAFGWGERTAFSAQGNVRGTRVGWADLVDAQALDGPVTATWSPERGVNVVAGLDLHAVSPAAAPDYAAATGRLDGTVAIGTDGALAIDADAVIVGLTGPEVRAERLAVKGALTRSAAGRLDGEADVSTGPLVVADLKSDRGVGHVRFEGDTVAVVLDLWDGERTLLGVDGELDVKAMAMRARRLELAPNAELVWAGEGVQTLRLVPGGVQDVHLRLVSDNSVLAVDGGGVRGGLIDLKLDVRDARLDWLASVWPDRFAGYAGRVDARASLEGHSSRPALYVDVSAVGLTVPGAVQGMDLDVQGVGGDRRLSLEGLVRAGGQTLARLEGDLPFSLAIDAPGLLTAGDLELHVVLPPAGNEAWTAMLPGVSLPVFRASGELSLVGPVLDPVVGLVVALSAPVGQEGDWVRVDLDGATVDGLFQLRAVARERLERRAQIDGTVALHVSDVVRSLLGEGPAVDLASPAAWAGAIELDVVPLRLPIQTLATFVDLPASLLGDLSGGLHVSGQARAPRVEGALFLSGGHLGDLPLSPALVAVVPAEGGYQVDASLGFGEASAATLSGFVPFDPTLDTDLAVELKRSGLALVVTAADVPLAAVGAAWPTLTATSGTLDATGTITGSLSDPQPDLTFGLTDADFVLALTGVRYHEVSFSGRLGPTDVEIKDLNVRTSRIGRAGKDARAMDGRVTGGMTARREEKRASFGGDLVFDNAWIVDKPDQVLRTDGKLHVEDRDEKIRITGNLAVVEGQLFVSERFFSGRSDLALDPDIVVIRGDTAAAEGPMEGALAVEEGPPMPEWLDLDVDVALDRNAFIDATLPLESVVGGGFQSLSSINVNAQLDGDLAVRIANGNLSLVGQLLPLRGVARVFSVPFELTGEAISFTGREYTDPVLDLVAVHNNADYGAITTNITGTPSDLRLAFSSENSDLAPDDVLAVLLLGRPLNEADTGDASANGDLLTAALSTIGNTLVKSQVTASSRALDVLEVDVTGSIRAGRRVPGTDNMFLLGTYNWNVADPTEENVAEVTLEVRLDKAWQFDFTTGTSGISSVGLYRKWRF